MLVPQAKIMCLGRKCLCLRRNSHLLTPVIKGKRRSENQDGKRALETSIWRTFEDQGAWRQGFEGGNTSRSSSTQNNGFEGSTKDNPGHESCKAINLRNRVVPSPEVVTKKKSESNSEREKEKNNVEGEVEKNVEGEVEKECEKIVEFEDEIEELVENEKESDEKKVEKKKGKSVEEKEEYKEKENSVHAKLPYPRKKKAKTNDHQQFKKFMKMLHDLQINIPFAEVLEQMPVYAKFMKDLLTKKRKPLDDDTVDMTEECSAIIQKKLPQKKKDPGSFTIPCSIGNISVGRALCDLGASINLMPLSMMKKIPGAVAKPTKMQLSLADRSIVHPYGILHDVLVRVAEFVFPADFVILDMEDDAEVEPLLLGRPFLATGRALIDVEMGELMLRTHGEQVMFNVFKAMKHHDDEPQCYKVDVIEEVVEDVLVEETPSLPLERVIVNSIDDLEEEWDKEIEICLRQLEACKVEETSKDFENVYAVEEKESVKEDPKDTTPELKELPSHLKYVFLGEDSSQPAIISSELSSLEAEKLVRVLRDNKEAMGWSIEDLKGISPGFCMHKIKLEDEYKPVVQPQRRLNPTMKEVVKKEVLKLLKAGMIYPISDSAWVSPVHVVPKKGGMTVVRNEKNELIPTRTVTGWRMCIDYRRLNLATRKDHFPLPFMDQMLESLAGQAYYCFLDGYSGYNQIVVDPADQEKTAFTCPFGVFAYRRMPFGLCNAPATFQRCMLSIFADMMENSIEVFMDDFSVFGKSFDHCLANLNAVLKRCISTNLVLNWEKCHFMVKEGIVLGHKISSKGIQVDQAKIEVIKDLPPPVNVKGVRSFLGHAGFYRRFIKDFSKIAKPLSNLLVKENEFNFDADCLKAFVVIKEKLVTAPIIIAPNWDLPFELMCDASDYAVGAVLGQRHEKFFHAIYYASKVLNENQINYTTTEKELLAIVFALEKFRSYLIGSKVVVFSDHSALKYLLTKGDSKPRLLRWILLLQEFDLEIKDKKGVENVVADHLSRLENPIVTMKEKCINEDFLDEKLLMISKRPWFADMANFKAGNEIPEEYSSQQKKKFFRDANFYFWDDPYLFKKKGKEVGESSSRGKGSKRQRTTRAATPSPPSSPTPSPPREDSPPPPPPAAVIDIPRNRFNNATAYRRYQQIGGKAFKPERYLTEEVLAFPIIKEEFDRRNWYKFNSSLNTGNRTVALEFLSNGWRVKAAQKRNPQRVVKVRGVNVDYSPEAINSIFGFEVPEVCVVQERRACRSDMSLAQREALKSQLSLPGSEWIKLSKNNLPSRFKTARLLDISRIWAEFWINNVEPCGNNSEITIDIALAIQAILLGEGLNLGYFLSEDLDELMHKEIGSYSLVHCNLITALCEARRVPEEREDQMEKPSRKVSLAFVDEVRRKTMGRLFIPFADINDMMEEGREDVGIPGEEPVHNVGNENQPHAPDTEGFPAPQYDESVLSEMLCRMDLCNQAGIDMEDNYDMSSALWQQTMAYRAIRPAYFYPRYQTMKEFDEAHMRRMDRMNATHEVNRATFIRQRRAAGLPDEGPSDVPFPGGMPRFDDDHVRPDRD
ncbi:unnamed protein product [Trifolium pratense]|uniref:Uncharacterized protein n=1 Tax=Trifolium pratense TaxID=57577 RepID=A0ACB0L6I1_TRIPR|nr:unnamed protein product [Trifolium pratense]